MSISTNALLWVAQWFLALAFLGAGAFKLVGYDAYARMVTKQGSVPLSRAFAGFVGAAEIAGAAGVVLPMALNVVPSLSPWAALGLATVMLLACGYHLRERSPAYAPIVLLFVAAFVAYGRFGGGIS